MKIAVSLSDQSFTRTKSMGIFNVSMGLTRELMQHPDVTELHILGNDECSSVFADCPPHVHLHLMDKPVPRSFGRVWWDQFGLPAAVRRIAPDWLLLPKGVPPFFPCMGATKIACYVHDVMWEHYEQRPFGDRQKAFPLHEFIYFKNLSLRAMRTADVVLTHTKFNEERIHSYVPQAKISRIGIGFDAPALPNSELKGRDILTYGSTFPHKRLDLTFDRLTKWLNQRPDSADIRIHLVGSIPEGISLPDERWIHHKRIPYTQLCDLLQQQCRMAVYFSDYESYGMPPVECLLNGVPCLASDIPPIRENLPEQYLVPNEDPDAFIHTANNCYDGRLPFTCPTFPDWKKVTNLCIQALKNA
ncbi:MAG: glycosyltransferase [Akkermansia sp.]|nr:glycosyltransferase [Akkermansia sp.]